MVVVLYDGAWRRTSSQRGTRLVVDIAGFDGHSEEDVSGPFLDLKLLHGISQTWLNDTLVLLRLGTQTGKIDYKLRARNRSVQIR